MANLLDDDLSKLSAKDLARVVRFIEDRNLNGIAALAVRLELYRAGRQTTEEVLVAAEAAVKKIVAAVEEARSVRHQQAVSRG